MISFRAGRASLTALAFLAGLGFASANAATWKVDYGKSKLGYTILWDGEDSVALFQKWQAQIDFDPANPAAAKITVTISTASGVSDFPDYDPDRDIHQQSGEIHRAEQIRSDRRSDHQRRDEACNRALHADAQRQQRACGEFGVREPW